MNSSIVNSSILDEYIKRFTDMTQKLNVVDTKDDINDVIRFTGIFLKAAQQRKKVIDKADSRNKMYQSKAERNADKKDADKDDNSDSAASDTSSETAAPKFNYT